MGGAQQQVQLRWGYESAAGRQHSICVRPLNGFDEEFLIESTSAMLPAQRVNALLERCTSVPGADAQSGATVRSLSAGDRELVAMELRRLTFGDRLTTTLNCSRQGCGLRLDLDLQLADFVRTASPGSPRQEREFVDGTWRVYFRLPTGADQEAAASAAAASGVAAGVQVLLDRCVSRAENVQTGEAVPANHLPLHAVEQLAAAMADLDPLAEIRLEVQCPHCGSSTPMLFDAGLYLCDEIASRGDALLREVHLLAYHYGWSESDILGMSRRKRRRYIELLLDALDPDEVVG